MHRIRTLALAGLAAAFAGGAFAQEITIKAVSSFAEGTKDSLGFEALIIVNNTPEAEYKAPVAARCGRRPPSATGRRRADARGRSARRRRH